ncbi:TetR/AcrR family transcriptional regulator [Microbacterium sp. Marseille-Q6965]|uniref:TetR/AcrR family transcriptional regulator n=1 Tax=Microbacterium sp. Marseille-Q6965 TaxID=2965072 RepID=UPI0021B7695D|nr:TetR/AcrR family transcriptional regulator [Microbacterium sp. Marseille-Q6965]
MSDPSKTNRGPAAAPANRRALIAAARELFAEQGFGVPFSQVAKRAGVGQASLYRHFPDKTALAIAVFDENLAALEAQAHDLRGLLELIVAQARMSASLLEVLAPTADAAAPALAQRLERIIAAILERERAAGRVDASITVDDVATAVSMVAFHTAFSSEHRADAGRAAIALIERALAP